MPGAPDDPPAKVLKASDEAVAAAAAGLDPSFPTLSARYVAEGGSLEYGGVIARNVKEMAGLELPHWSQGALHLPDLLGPPEGRFFEMNDTGEVLQWCHFEEYRAWLMSVSEAMTRCFTHDFTWIQTVSILLPKVGQFCMFSWIH